MHVQTYRSKTKQLSEQLLDQCILQSEERLFILQKFQMDRNWNLLVWVPQQELSDPEKYS